MQIHFLSTDITKHTADALLLYISQNKDPHNTAQRVDTALDHAISELISMGDFTGKAEEVAVLYTRRAIASKRVILVGLGQSDNQNADTLRRAVALGVQEAQSLNLKSVATYIPSTRIDVQSSAQALTEGALLGAYHYHGQKSDDSPHELTTMTIISGSVTDSEPINSGIATGSAFAEGTILARDLINLPPNIATPAYMANRAQTMAEQVGLKCVVLDTPQMQALKMGALLGVAQGSDSPPKFIILEHNVDKKADENTIVLVGKGVTFDTGGYTLKSRDGLIGMKADMSGGAAVIGAMLTIAKLDIPLHVVGLIPTADNMISGKAYRPQEVLTASNGTTIEIISTDAEGRLLLADALVYAQRYNPAAVVDIATLTGSITVALGHAMTGVFSNDDTVVEKLNLASETTSEYIWRMPMIPEHGDSLKSETADTKNSGGRAAGASVAAHFLSNFVDYNWAHIDMAGMLASEGKTPYQPAHSARGYGSRLLAEFVRQWGAL